MDSERRFRAGNAGTTGQAAAAAAEAVVVAAGADIRSVPATRGAADLTRGEEEEQLL